MNASVFRDIWARVMFLKFSKLQFENFKNITIDHISRNALAFIRFSVYIFRASPIVSIATFV